MKLHCYIVMRLQIVIVPFALYVCAMEKMPSGNTDTAFASNYDHDYNSLYGTYILKDCVVFQCINVLRNIMELILLWVSKRLLKNGIITIICSYIY